MSKGSYGYRSGAGSFKQALTNMNPGSDAGALWRAGFRPIYNWNVTTRPADELKKAWAELQARRVSGRNMEVWS